MVLARGLCVWNVEGARRSKIYLLGSWGEAGGLCEVCACVCFLFFMLCLACESCVFRAKNIKYTIQPLVRSGSGISVKNSTAQPRVLLDLQYIVPYLVHDDVWLMVIVINKRNTNSRGCHTISYSLVRRFNIIITTTSQWSLLSSVVF